MISLPTVQSIVYDKKKVCEYNYTYIQIKILVKIAITILQKYASNVSLSLSFIFLPCETKGVDVGIALMGDDE